MLVALVKRNFLIVPFYAKMSFWDRSILYFDMQFALGVGNMTYEKQADPTQIENQTKTALAYNFDVTQQLFFHKHFAVRFDVKNKWSKQEKFKYRTGGTNGADRDLGSSTQQDTSMLLGLTFWY